MMRRPFSWLLLIAAIGMAMTFQEIGAQAEGADVLRGRVLTSEGVPVAGAVVTATALESKVVRTIRTNDQGVYTILFANGDGEYVVTVKAIGYVPLTRRVLKSDESNVIVTDFHMPERVQQLDAVKVTAAAGSRRPIDEKGEPPIGDNVMDGEIGKLFSLDPSDIASLFRGMVGVTLLPDKDGNPGLSVLGAAPDQNKTVLNGSTFNGANIPEGAVQSVSLAKTDFDASHGGFAGGRISIIPRTGSNIRSTSLTVLANDSRLSVSDPAYVTPATSSQRWNGVTSGPIKKNFAFYHGAFSITHNALELQSLLNPTRTTLLQSGVNLPTVAAASDALRTIGVPLTTSGIPHNDNNVAQSYSLNVNVTPTATMTAGLNTVVSATSQSGGGINGLTFPSMGMESRALSTLLQLYGTTYIGRFLNETKLGVNHATDVRDPYVRLPGGTVLVPSQFDDGRTGLTSLQFGGNPAGLAHASTTSVELNNATSWLTNDSRHQIKLAEGVSFTHNIASAVTDPFGTYTYRSLAELATNAPSSYTRTLSSRATERATFTSWASIGDNYRVNKHLSLTYGLRTDVAHPGRRPAYNPAVDSLFGLRTDRVPHSIGLSPRVGFAWSEEVTPSQRAFMQQQALLGKPTRTPVRVSGGIGAFRGSISPEAIAALADQTGLPNTMRYLNCVGAAVPIPDWTHFAADGTSAPESCLDGTAPVTFSTSQPNVKVYDPSFRAPVSWRGNLDLAGLQWKRWQISVGGVYSLGLNNESTIDRNRRYIPIFTLPDEGRPVFVDPAEIVPASGVVAPGASRVTPQFGSVTTTLSDLRSVNTELSLSLTRSRPLFGKMPLYAHYALNGSRQQVRDAGGPDPLAVVWTSGVRPKHQLVAYTQYTLWRVGISLSANINSGSRYTPVVNADINGSGNGLQSAFIFDPAHTQDSVLARQMGLLINSSDTHVRDCLRRSLGQIAGLNSCETGWRFLLVPNLAFNLNGNNPSKRFGGTDSPVRISVLTQNTMSLVARLFGISNTSLLRTTTYMPVDPTLLYVTGFDPITRRYSYQVNQQFGDSRRRQPTINGRPQTPPFSVYLQGEIHLGGDQRRTLAQGLGLVAAKRGDPQPPLDTVKARLRKLMQNPVEQVLTLQDSLLLSQKQIESIRTVQARFDAETNVLMQPLAEYVVAQGRNTDDAQLQKRVAKVQEKVREVMVVAVKDVGEVLTDQQKERLPGVLKLLLKTQ